MDTHTETQRDRNSQTGEVREEQASEYFLLACRAQRGDLGEGGSRVDAQSAGLRSGPFLLLRGVCASHFEVRCEELDRKTGRGGGFSSSEAVAWHGALYPGAAGVTTQCANPGTFANPTPGLLAPCPAGRLRAPATRRSWGWPAGGPGPLSLSPFVLFISGSSGGPGARAACRPLPRPHRHFNAPQVAGCCALQGGGGPGALCAPADSDRRARLTRAPSACLCAPARVRPSRGSADQDGPRLGGGRASAAGGRRLRRGGGGSRARLRGGCAETVRHESEPVGDAARAFAGAAGSRPRGGRPGARAVTLQPGRARAPGGASRLWCP